MGIEIEYEIEICRGSQIPVKNHSDTPDNEVAHASTTQFRQQALDLTQHPSQFTPRNPSY